MIFGVPAPPALGRAVLAACVSLLAGAAWLMLWLADATGAGLLGFLQHHHHGHAAHGYPTPLFPLVFVGGWTVMTVAMMLPSSLPVLMTFHAIAGERPGRSFLLVLAVAGYLAAWTAFGAAVYFAVLLANGLMAAVPWVHRHSSMVTPLLFFIAGAFQFSPLKYRCLDKCRSPLSFVVEHWQGNRNRRNAFRLGLDSGIFCVGCCWALMLLMFAFSVGSLAWMFLLAIVMAVEKNVPWGRRMSAPVGVSLILAGVALLFLV
jgi:predicted metal-binding membrane protein